MKPSLDQLKRGRALYNEWKRTGLSQRKVAKVMGIDENYGRKLIKFYRDFVLNGDVELPPQNADDPYQYVETEDGAFLFSDRITEPDQLLEASGVDLTVWEVDRIQLQYDETHRKETVRELQWTDSRMNGFISDSGKMHVEPVMRCKIWLKRREVAPFEEAVDELLARVERKAPTYKAQKYKSDGGYLFVVGMVDAHFNRLSANGSYSIDDAAERFMDAGEALCQKVQRRGYDVGRILLPVGNDALNADNLVSTTTKGTWVETSGQQAHAIQRVIEAYEYVIQRLTEIAPVDVVGVPGNHDFYSTIWLVQTLAGLFKKHPNVTVNIDPSPHKYYRFGTVMLGLAHGHEKNPTRLALTMAAEADLSGVKFREWLTAHLHRERGMYVPVTEEGGYTVRTLPALCESDNWHILKGFLGESARALALLYHTNDGIEGQFTVLASEVPEREKR